MRSDVTLFKEFVGKDVIVWPSDTYPKYAQVLEITPEGSVFLVKKDPKGRCTGWDDYIGRKFFIAFSARLMFVEAEGNE